MPVSQVASLDASKMPTLTAASWTFLRQLVVEALPNATSTNVIASLASMEELVLMSTVRVTSSAFALMASKKTTASK